MKRNWMKDYLLPEGKERMTGEAYRRYTQLVSHERYISRLARRHEILLGDMEALGRLAAGASACHLSVYEAALHASVAAEMMACLQKLPKQDRELILELFFNNGDMSERRIAKKLGIPRTTLQYRKERILKKLKSMLET